MRGWCGESGRVEAPRDVDAKHYADGRWTTVVSRLSNSQQRSRSVQLQRLSPDDVEG